jgi:hypothetical protein
VGEDDSPLREYVYGQGHGALAQTSPGAGPEFFHADHLGTTRRLTNSAGGARMSAPAGYTPFGEATSGDLGSLTSLAFTGQFREPATDATLIAAEAFPAPDAKWIPFTGRESP